MISIKRAQDIIKEKYYSKDAERGVFLTFIWLVEEVGELADAIKKGDKEALKEEISDVLAWLFSLANILEIDVEVAFREKYIEDKSLGE